MNLVGNKYKLLEKIGEGSFGSIYKGENIRTKELVAIKVEPIKNNTKLLKNESIIYQFLIIVLLEFCRRIHILHMLRTVCYFNLHFQY